MLKKRVLARRAAAALASALVAQTLLAGPSPAPAGKRPADRFLKVTRWEGRVHLVYDFREAKENASRTIHAVTDWTATLDPLDQSTEPGLPLLTFNGAWLGRGSGGESAEYPAGKGDRHTTSHSATGTAEVWVSLKLYADGYEFDGFGWVDFKGTMQGTCSKGTCTFDPEGSVCVSNSDDWSVRRPYPGAGLVLSGSATLSAGAEEQKIAKGNTYAVSWEFRPAGETPPLAAVPEVAATVERGEALALDGSRSKGRIRDYLWTFKAAGAPGGEPPDPKAEKRGAKAEVVLLDSMSVTLTVSDGKATDSRTVAVKVVPRERFRTPFKHLAEEGVIASSLKPYCTSTNRNSRGEKEFFAVWDAGENVCAIDPPASSKEKPHIVHPDPEKAGGDGKFEVAAVSDPGGPWDGFYYVSEWTCEIRRQTLLNKYIVKDAPPIFSGMAKNFYQANQEGGKNPEAYLNAIRRHEKKHSDLMQAALAGRDPAKEAERAFGKDEGRLRREAEDILRKAEERIHGRTKDPLPEDEWTGQVLVPKDDTYEWMSFEARVGGTSSSDL